MRQNNKTIEPLFELSKIKKTYAREKKSALDIKKLIIPKNNLVAVIGYSGSGKTTLLNILGLIDIPDPNNESEIKFFKNNGISILTKNIKDMNKFRRRNFGFIFQQGYLMSNLTGRANIEIPMHVNGFEVSNKTIDELLIMAGITDDQDYRLPSDISGGEAQRIAFIRSIAHSPDVILADEPTSNLDHDAGLQLIGFLKNLCKSEKPKSVIWITHNIHQAVSLADYIIVLKNGTAQGPYENPKKIDHILKWLRHDDNKQQNYNYQISITKPETAKKPVLNLFRFLAKFAISDIFPKTSNNSKGILPAIFGIRNSQTLSMLSLFLVICFTLLLLSISYAFKNYYIYSVSDPLINKITISDKRRGDQSFTKKDLNKLSNLVWAKNDKIISRRQIIWAEEARKQGMSIIRNATMGAYGIYRRKMDCYMNPNSKNRTFYGIIDLELIAFNIDDPILTKIPLIKDSGEKYDNIKIAFTDKNQKSISDMEGVIITKNAIKRELDFQNTPKLIKIKHIRAEDKKIPILGVVESLPYGVDILITEAWYLKQFWKTGSKDPMPAYDLINIYVKDKIKDGLPVCEAIELMGYRGIGDIKNTLIWISNMTEIIFKFSSLAMIGIWILAGSSLFVSCARTIRGKKKEIGLLMAKGITKPMLYFVFWFEIIFVWLISTAFALPAHYLFFKMIKSFVETRFSQLSLNIPLIFNMPDLLCPGVLLATLVLALITVFFGIRDVLKHNVATILRTVE